MHGKTDTGQCQRKKSTLHLGWSELGLLMSDWKTPLFTGGRSHDGVSRSACAAAVDESGLRGSSAIRAAYCTGSYGTCAKRGYLDEMRLPQASRIMAGALRIF